MVQQQIKVNESWKDVVEYEGLYLVSKTENYGVISKNE